MPIFINEIIIPINEENITQWGEDEDENKQIDTSCDLCEIVLEISRDNNWKPIPHTLDICLKYILRRGDI